MTQSSIFQRKKKRWSLTKLVCDCARRSEDTRFGKFIRSATKFNEWQMSDAMNSLTLSYEQKEKLKLMKKLRLSVIDRIDQREWMQCTLNENDSKQKQRWLTRFSTCKNEFRLLTPTSIHRDTEAMNYTSENCTWIITSRICSLWQNGRLSFATLFLSGFLSNLAF